MADLEEAFYSGLVLMGLSDYRVRANYHDFASLKAVMQRTGNLVTVKASRGFEAGGREVLVGLALDLIGRSFRRRVPENAYTSAFQEFFRNAQAVKLSHSLKRRFGRQRRLQANGSHHDLNDVVLRLIHEYPVLQELPVPKIGWNAQGGARLVGFYDEAAHEILISNRLDQKRVPFYVLEYVVFHELLHAKHPSKHNATRRTVHSMAFKTDEQKYPFYQDAMDWLKRHDLNAHWD
ncbi:M48 family metallopeptidase [Candidatus Micrarchaeota archaeon]|nr:M48 family metallopeptidase [Candidatus Micrarchaeota archaeon]